MTRLLLTPRAYQLLYSSPGLCLVGETVVERFRGRSENAALPLLRLGADGVVYAPDETDQRTQLPLTAPIGIASGLLAIIVTKTEASAAEDWRAFAESQGRTVPVHQLSDSFSRARREAEFGRVLLDIVAGRLKGVQEQLGAREQQLVALRRSFERKNVSLEAAKRMMDTLAVQPMMLAFEAAPSGDFLENDETRQSVRLPCDATGFASLDLFFEPASTAPTGGKLVVSVRRAIDGTQVLKEEVLYESVSPGWRLFTATGQTIFLSGDLVLELEWQDGDSAAGRPKLALADRYVHQFDSPSPDGRALAMRIFKGFVHEGDAELDDVFGGDILAEAWRKPLSLAKGHDVASFISGPDAEIRLSKTLGESPISWNLDEGWLQTHLVAEEPSGIWMTGFLPKGGNSIHVHVENHHHSGPHSLFVMVAARPGRRPAASALMALATSIRKGEVAMTGQHKDGYHWAAANLLGGAAQDLGLHAEAPFETDMDVAVFSVPLSDSSAYGWCRWSDFRMGILVASLERSDQLPAKAWMGSERRFPELSNRLEALGEPGLLAAMQDRYGFPPLMITEDMAALQTHPVRDGMAAAYFPNCVPSGTMAIDLDFGGGHREMPECLFVAAVVHKNDKKAVEAFAEILAGASPTNLGGMAGQTDGGAVQWSAAVTKGDGSGRITMQLESPVAETVGLAFAARSLSDDMNYAWCRWYSMKFFMVCPPELRTVV